MEQSIELVRQFNKFAWIKVGGESGYDSVIANEDLEEREGKLHLLKEARRISDSDDEVIQEEREIPSWLSGQRAEV